MILCLIYYISLTGMFKKIDNLKINHEFRKRKSF